MGLWVAQAAAQPHPNPKSLALALGLAVARTLALTRLLHSLTLGGWVYALAFTDVTLGRSLVNTG